MCVVYDLSVFKTYCLSDPPSCLIVWFLRGMGERGRGSGIGIKLGEECRRKWLDFERVIPIPFRIMNNHDHKMFHAVVPPKIPIHKRNLKGLKVFLYISCIYSLMSQQIKTHE